MNSKVLVLNRSYLPVHVTSVRRAFSLLYQGLAQAVDGEYRLFDFASWRAVEHAPDDDAIGLVSGAIRVPRVILLVAYNRVPKRHVRFSRHNVFARDQYRCQYCGRRCRRAELNLDHVIPRARGGISSWENVVSSCVDCNRRKGGRTPGEAGLRLLRRPYKPQWTPFVIEALGPWRYREWRPFLNPPDTSYYGECAELSA